MKKLFDKFKQVKEKLTLIVVLLAFVLILVGLILTGIVDMKLWKWDMGFVETSSAFAESVVDLYNFVWIFLIFTLGLVVVILMRIIFLFAWNIFVFQRSYLRNSINYFTGLILSFKNRIFFLNADDVINHLYKLNQFGNSILKYTVFYLDYDKYEFLHISDLNEHKKLEIVWSLLPTIVLAILIWPTFSLIFSLDPDVDPVYTIKVIGHQWYWTYSISGLTSNEDKFDLTFDSVMINEEDLLLGQLRLLEVDNRLVLPVCVPIRFLITATDVLHSWAVPSLGLKVDAVPGRINQFLVEIKRPGMFYGQCSEICGPNHGFMPIIVQALEFNEFEQWLLDNNMVN